MTDDTEPPADRTLSWWPLVGAAVIAALVAVVIFAVGAGDDNRSGSRIDDDGALACPGTYASSDDNLRNRVPAVPSGVAGKAALVPDATPRYVAVCRYVPAKGAAGKKVDTPLDGRVVLTSGARAAATRLNQAPKTPAGARRCVQYVDRVAPSYLLGFTFDTGVVWVSVPSEGCFGASNGQFDTAADLTSIVATAYSTKAWPT